MRAKIAAAAVGLVFGITLGWTGLSDPDVIRDALLFRDAYVFLLFGAGVAATALGVRVLRRLRMRALLTGEPISWSTAAPQRRHVVGSVVFGTGWAIAAACPGPIAAQVGQGVVWSVFTLVGVAIGIELYSRRQPAASPAEQTRPASSAVSAHAATASPAAATDG